MTALRSAERTARAGRSVTPGLSRDFVIGALRRRLPRTAPDMIFFCGVFNFVQRADICVPYLLGVLNPTCPNCRSSEPTVTHESVGTGFYFCRACEHAWYEERRTSPRPSELNTREPSVNSMEEPPQEHSTDHPEGATLRSHEA